MRWLVCGGRDFHNYPYICEVLDTCLVELGTPDFVVHGDCRGADRLADKWARSKGIHSARCSALWETYDKAAGYKRNAAMILLSPTHCIPFPGGEGTAMMVQLARSSGVIIYD